MNLKKKKKSYKVKNLSPGTMAYRGKKQTTAISIDIINYNGDSYKREHSNRVEDAFNHKGNDQVTWININGLNNIKEIETIGLHYELHPLTLEDIVNTHQRPKIDEFENHLYIVFKMLYFKDDDQLTKEHVSMIVGKDYILTFQEADGDVFDDLRDRINSTKGRIRMRGADYLMYAILDAIVDNYFSVIEAFGDKIEELERHIFESSTSSNETPNKIQALKQDVLKIRRAIFPLREVINRLDKTDINFLEIKTHDYLKDLHDHIIQVCESIDLYREMVWSLMDMYMTIINNKMNEVMKVLTIMASIFIPLTFIAGIYGMNFDHMPELHTKNGYYILLGAMAVIFVLMLFYFRRKKWL
ncbi:magnesium/cobalt transporter CorA [Subsaximicrobium wynnwilliamsii]|uniref:Magnesium transport protein CorA n=1 Tax=Subsaximicrobium wynnwilliamsii TaxID=291179 RepID=A0A5C6ZIU5_9FLAO|nr:magnesium/cobalt transporter CorA [Subsaximicrobium wynnwilliamsii]TXD84120.1 magnesium/cobalt transporter CorA [Subsaximicrobium wynnwilliamsii]TXD88922.1 magnesium/cobalt transporter CorA [Subsaximicrobium wynnwilliamsii]TXE03832.1 magnesium/cobalt transporter CorA [Subsaximicrobium wynnwilliamsii]